MWKIIIVFPMALLAAACQITQPIQSDVPKEHINTEIEFSNTRSEQIPDEWQKALSTDFSFITRHGYWSVLCKNSTKGCWATARVADAPNPDFIRVQVARIFSAPPHYRALSVSFTKEFHTSDGVIISTPLGLSQNYDFSYCHGERCTSRAIFNREQWEDLMSAGEISFSAFDRFGRRHYATIGVKRLEEALGVAEHNERLRYGDVYRGVTLP